MPKSKQDTLQEDGDAKGGRREATESVFTISFSGTVANSLARMLESLSELFCEFCEWLIRKLRKSKDNGSAGDKTTKD